MLPAPTSPDPDPAPVRAWACPREVPAEAFRPRSVPWVPSESPKAFFRFPSCMSAETSLSLRTSSMGPHRNKFRCFPFAAPSIRRSRSSAGRIQKSGFGLRLALLPGYRPFRPLSPASILANLRRSSGGRQSRQTVCFRPVIPKLARSQAGPLSRFAQRGFWGPGLWITGISRIRPYRTAAAALRFARGGKFWYGEAVGFQEFRPCV